MSGEKRAQTDCADTTIEDVRRWARELAGVHARIAHRFARPEPRRRAFTYLQGLLSPTERKNGWQLAEYGGEATPDGIQRLLTTAKWDADLVRDDLHRYVIEQFGDPFAVLIADETSFPKQGRKSVGVQPQYCGTTGQVENCQVGVFLAYATAKGHTFLDRELYLPLSWTQDRERCCEAGIPEHVRFQTKCELVRLMIERAITAQVPFYWVVADSLYGSDQDLREWLESQSRWYVLAVRSNVPVGISTPDGLRRMEISEVEASLIDPDDWQRLSMSEGTKGPRLFDWVRVPILHQWEDDGQHWLLIRRQLSAPFERTYYLVYGPKTITLQELVCVTGARWHIEEVFESAKGEVGLDHYEVRTWMAWYRHYSECSLRSQCEECMLLGIVRSTSIPNNIHITLAMLAHAFLAAMCAHTPPSTQDHREEERPWVLPLTIAEVRHLLWQLVWPCLRDVKKVLAWSWWRRLHRTRAKYFHMKCRLNTG